MKDKGISGKNDKVKTLALRMNMTCLVNKCDRKGVKKGFMLEKRDQYRKVGWDYRMIPPISKEGF